ncbi:MAG TPA: hypothetical protein VJ816_02930 [Gemmatimonadales bacterium]|nr:hypothetical protein [Gemmatimonadales bacterium]
MAAQGTGTSLSGVLRRGAPRGGGAPLAGRWVVLHRVTMQEGGPIDSVRTDAAGRWRIRVPAVDSEAIYVVSSMYAGLAYFSQPLHPVPGRGITADPLVVYDTSTTGPPLILQRRLVTIAHPKDDGSRDVLELLELVNPGFTTRIAPDTLRPVWAGAIPAAAMQFEVQSGDFSSDAVARRGDQVRLFGPLQPGGFHQLSYAYTLPASVEALALPIDQPTVELDLLLEDTLAQATAPGLRGGGVQPIERRFFMRYRTESLPAGAPVRIAFPKAPIRAERVLPFLVVAVAAALGFGLWVALKKRPQTSDV